MLILNTNISLYVTLRKISCIIYIKPLISYKISPETAIEAYHWLRDKKDETLGVIINWE